MLIDLCNGMYSTSVTADKVSTDHHEVSNLVSNDHSSRNRGFIAETFIKPPVNVTVTLPFNVELYRIILNPIQGRQKSSAFEIFTYNKKITESECFNSTYLSKDASNLLFQSVGRASLKEVGVVCFQNGHYKSWGDWNYDDCNTSYDNCFHLRHHKVTYLSVVSHVVIRIKQTQGGSAVCLHSLQIWGQPSRSSPKSVVNRLRLLIKPNQMPNGLPGNQDIQRVIADKDKALKNESISKSEFIESGITVPEEFVDKITCELMTIPILLPSGENIDQSTLEKHIAAEARWGRAASDPFTGNLLQDKFQAVPNVGLKTRIDSFMLSHVDSLGNLPRTLGSDRRTDSYNGPSTSSLVGKRGYESVRSEDVVSKRQKISDNVSSNYTSYQRLRKTDIRQKSNYSLDGNRKLEQAPNNSNNVPIHNSATSLITSNGKTSMNNDVTNSNPLCHSDDLKSSLDSALFQTLGSLPSFTSERTHYSIQNPNIPSSFSSSKISFPTQNSSESSSPSSSSSSMMPSGTLQVKNRPTLNMGNRTTQNYSSCSVCRTHPLGAAYTGNCQHVICRECLTHATRGNSNYTCNCCNVTWDTQHIVRVFV